MSPVVHVIVWRSAKNTALIPRTIPKANQNIPILARAARKSHLDAADNLRQKKRVIFVVGHPLLRLRSTFIFPYLPPEDALLLPAVLPLTSFDRCSVANSPHLLKAFYQIALVNRMSRLESKSGTT